MTDQEKEHCRAQIEPYLQAKGIDTRKAFKCLNPEHDDHTPSMSLPRGGRRVRCFSLCNRSFDIFDLIAIDYPGLTPAEVFKKAGELFGVSPGLIERSNNFKPDANHETKHEPQPTTDPAGKVAMETQNPAIIEQVAAYILKAHQAVDQTDYYQSRGLTRATIERYKLGFDPSRGAAIIPCGERYYLRRMVDVAEGVKGKRYDNLPSKIYGGVQLFNAQALRGNEPVFITEGAFNALSVIEAGGQAIALNSVGNGSLLLEHCKRERPTAPLILSLDNDDPGRAGAAKLAGDLLKLGIPTTKADLCQPGQDLNQALRADREALARAVERAVEYAQYEQEVQHEQEVQEAQQEHDEQVRVYRATSAGSLIQWFRDSVAAGANTPVISTGFETIDKALDGGLYAGLYCIGAITSLGKTTLALQVGDQIARAGQDVLIFSLEMATAELMAKSISRETFYLDQSPLKSIAKSNLGVMVGRRYAGYSTAEREIIEAGIERYSQYAGRVYISEGIGNIGVAEVREKLERHVELTGNRPVVIIDYLQILAPDNPRATDKQNTDKAVLELKRISRDFTLPVVAVSSFNRMSYNDPVTLAAFKESGAIEYSSDVLIGLQFRGVGTDYFDVDKAKDRPVREIEFKVLKNRSYKTGAVVPLAYYPVFNCFEEVKDKTPDNLPLSKKEIKLRLQKEAATRAAAEAAAQGKLYNAEFAEPVKAKKKKDIDPF